MLMYMHSLCSHPAYQRIGMQKIMKKVNEMKH
jgi:hypothetical protein